MLLLIVRYVSVLFCPVPYKCLMFAKNLLGSEFLIGISELSLLVQKQVKLLSDDLSISYLIFSKILALLFVMLL